MAAERDVKFGIAALMHRHQLAARQRLRILQRALDQRVEGEGTGDGAR